MSHLPARSRRRLPRAALPLFAAAAAIMGGARPHGTPTVAPGLLYTMQMTTQDATGGKSRELSSMAARTQIAGGKLRMEFTESKGASAAGPMKKGGYILLLDDGKRMLIVNPKEKSYLDMEPDAIFGMLNAMTAATGGLMKIEVSDLSSGVRKLGAGETVLGHATEKYEMTQKYTTTMSIMGRRNESTSESVTELWIATSISDWMNPFMEMGKSAADGMLSSAPGWATQMADVEAKMPKNGAVLKSVTRTTMRDGKGKEQLMLSTTEITELSRGDVPTSAFEVPTGYTRTEMPSMAAMQEATDSLNAAKARGDIPSDFDPARDAKDAAKEGVTEGVKEEAKAGAKAATKKALGGILRGKRPPL